MDIICLNIVQRWILITFNPVTEDNLYFTFCLNWMQIQVVLCLILHWYNLTFIKDLLRGQTCGKWTKNLSKRTSVHSCVTMYVKFYHAWPKMIDSFFPPPRLCCCCCLTQYSVVATAITYGTMFGLGTALAYTPPLGVAMRWFPKSKVPFIYYVSIFFVFWAPFISTFLLLKISK